jgi:hypothetical protein
LNKKDLIIDKHINIFKPDLDELTKIVNSEYSVNSIPDAIHFLISERKDSKQLDRIENGIRVLLSRDFTKIK